MIPLKFELRLFVLLALGFIAFTVVGTVSHESGHYLAARCLGYKAKLHYGSTSIQSFTQGEMDFLKSVYEKYPTQIKSNQPFPGKKRYDEICSRVSRRGIWFTLGGPLQTILTGTIGLLLMFVFRRRFFMAEKLTFWLWLLVFISLFWLRQAANFAVCSAFYILLGKRHFRGDEFALDWHFHFPMGTICIITAAIAVAVLLLVVFKFIPAKQRFTFITAGLAGGVTGYLLWLVWFGKIIMP
jgi:hypothetical protein